MNYIVVVTEKKNVEKGFGLAGVEFVSAKNGEEAKEKAIKKAKSFNERYHSTTDDEFVVVSCDLTPRKDEGTLFMGFKENEGNLIASLVSPKTTDES